MRDPQPYASPPEIHTQTLIWFQVLTVIALLVCWRLLRMPLTTAAEYCVVAGCFAYTLLGVIISVRRALARLQPWAWVGTYLSPFVSVSIYAALRYVLGLGILKSGIVWVVLYVTSRSVVSRVRRRVTRVGVL